MPDSREAGGAGLNTAANVWDCNVAGHLFVNGQDRCSMCGSHGFGSAVTLAHGDSVTFRSTIRLDGQVFPDPDTVLDGMAALQRAQELLDEGHGPPDAIRVLAEQRAQDLGVEVAFSRTLNDAGALRWRVTVGTRRGEVVAAPNLTQKQIVEMAIDSDEWQIEGWKNALREVGLL